jgi:GDP-4-dehydro-6-deoxy-D-mannose reductase
MNSSDAPKRILITGASGFTGRALIPFLQSAGESQLTLVDRVGDPAAGVAECNFVDASVVHSCISLTQPAEIYHLVGSFTQDFDIDFETNVTVTKNLCDALVALRSNARVLLIGSAAEYGAVAPDQNPIREDATLRPISVYGLTKAFQSALMQYYYGAHQLNVVMARTFNMYGLGISSRLFVGKIYEQIAAGTHTIEIDDLSAARDFLHISDVVRYYHLIMQRGVAGEVYNVGSGSPSNGADIIAKIAAECGKNPADFTATATGSLASVRRLFADVTKLHTL